MNIPIARSLLLLARRNGLWAGNSAPWKFVSTISRVELAPTVAQMGREPRSRAWPRHRNNCQFGAPPQVHSTQQHQAVWCSCRRRFDVREWHLGKQVIRPPHLHGVRASQTTEQTNALGRPCVCVTDCACPGNDAPWSSGPRWAGSVRFISPGAAREMRETTPTLLAGGCKWNGPSLPAIPPLRMTGTSGGCRGSNERQDPAGGSA